MKNVKLWSCLLFLSFLSFISKSDTNDIMNAISNRNYNEIIGLTSMWNFVVEAKNLTSEEKEYYNELGNISRSSPLMGASALNNVSAQVKLLDQTRELEKKLKELNELYNKLPNTNVIWFGSPETVNWQKDGSNSWVTIGNKMQSTFSDPKHIIGLRGDGIVIWKDAE